MIERTPKNTTTEPSKTRFDRGQSGLFLKELARIVAVIGFPVVFSCDRLASKEFSQSIKPYPLSITSFRMDI